MAEINELLDRARELLAANRVAEAHLLLTRAVDRAPQDAEAMHMLAVACFAAGDLEQSLRLFRKSLELAPEYPNFWSNYIGALAKSPNRLGDMLAVADEALRRFPQASSLAIAISDHFAAIGRYAERHHVLEQAVRSMPSDGELRMRLVQSYRQAGQYDRAVAMLSPLLLSLPRNIEVIRLHGYILTDQNKLPQADECWCKILAINPNDEDALLKLVVGRRKTCDWRDFEPLTARLRQQTEASLQAGKGPVETALLSLSTSTDSEYQLRVARAWAQIRSQPGHRRFAHNGVRSAGDNNGRITLGYISDELRDHPIGLLMRDYFTHHDRSRFRVVAYFDNPPDETDTVFHSIKAAAEESRLVHGMSTAALAELIHRDGVDILLDLKGWRQGNRMAALAMRPAPICVSFQGYPGTTGADYVDYIVVDDCIVPESEAATYTEKLAYVGRCYQVNDQTKPSYDVLRARAGTRRDHGLPESAIVLASFNQAYKLDPQMMTVWCDIMRTVPSTVLWLLELSEPSRENLRKFVAEHGVEPQRLIFAPWADHERHLARLTLADLGLDTRIYTGHATTSDSLWCRVPVITMAGQHFASRVSASILREVGLDDLIVRNLAEYRELALHLIGNPARRESLRSRLSTDHLRSTLFNTETYVRRVEDLFEQMVECHRAGRPPEMLRCRI